MRESIETVRLLRREARATRDNGVGSGWLEDEAADLIESLEDQRLTSLAPTQESHPEHLHVFGQDCPVCWPSS
jgi:hypothetical protein